MLSKLLLPAAVIGIAFSGYGCGASTGVYVGVAVPGPYIGYPGYGYPGYVGRPPYFYEEDALNLPAGARENIARTTDSGGHLELRCRSEERAGAICAADAGEQRTAETTDRSPSSSVAEEPGGR